MNRYEQFQGAPLGTPVTGAPTSLREGKITVVNADGTVSAKALNGRKGWEILPVPKWYAPQVGDIVLVAHIDGLRQRPVVLAPILGGGGGVPVLANVITDPSGHGTADWKVVKESPLNPQWAEYGAKGDGSTDDTAALQAWINAGAAAKAGELYAADGNYHFSRLTIPASTVDLRIRGAGDMHDAGNRCRLTSTYEGAEPAITAYGAEGLHLDGVSIVAAGAFTGTLLDLSRGAASNDTSLCCVENVRLQAPEGAARLLKLTKATVMTLRRIYGVGGKYAMDGMIEAGDYCNANTVADCYFSAQGVAAIHNLGDNCRVLHNTFEPLANKSAGAYLQDPTLRPNSLAFIANWMGDATTGGTWITVGGEAILILGNFLPKATKGILLNSATNGLTVVANLFQNLTNGIDLNEQTLENFFEMGNTPHEVTTLIAKAKEGLYGLGSVVGEATNSPLLSDGNIKACVGHASQIRIGNRAGAAPIIYFGTAEDTALYRNGEKLLRTDGSLQVGTNLEHLGAALGFYGHAAVAQHAAIAAPAETLASLKATCEALIAVLHNCGLTA